jgi:hypothetical protein
MDVDHGGVHQRGVDQPICLTHQATTRRGDTARFFRDSAGYPERGGPATARAMFPVQVLYCARMRPDR